jgi:hypothetical protein
MEARPWERNRRTRSFPLCPTPGCRTGLVYSLVIMEVGPFSLLCLLFHSIPWLCFAFSGAAMRKWRRQLRSDKGQSPFQDRICAQGPRRHPLHETGYGIPRPSPPQ